MFQLFLRARSQKILMSIFGTGEKFRARSRNRDVETDRTRIGAIMAAIEDALSAAEREQAGLTRRVEEVLARAAVTFGNGNDEYLEREHLDSFHHDLFDKEVQNGQRRLKELNSSIVHLRFLKAATLSRFRDIAGASGANSAPDRLASRDKLASF